MNEWSPEVIKEDQSEKVKCPIPDDISREPRRKKKKEEKERFSLLFRFIQIYTLYKIDLIHISSSD